MSFSTSRLALSAMALALFSLSACVAPGAVVTPQSLPGCWEGSAFANAASAKVEITATDETDVYNVDGTATGLGQTLPLNNIKVKYEDNQLKPQGVGQVVPLKLSVEGDKIVASSDQFPVTMELKRCN